MASIYRHPTDVLDLDIAHANIQPDSHGRYLIRLDSQQESNQHARDSTLPQRTREVPSSSIPDPPGQPQTELADEGANENVLTPPLQPRSQDGAEQIRVLFSSAKQCAEQVQKGASSFYRFGPGTRTRKGLLRRDARYRLVTVEERG